MALPSEYCESTCPDRRLESWALPLTAAILVAGALLLRIGVPLVELAAHSVFGNSGATGFASASTATGKTLAEPGALQSNGNGYFQTRSQTSQQTLAPIVIWMPVPAVSIGSVGETQPLNIPSTPASEVHTHVATD